MNVAYHEAGHAVAAIRRGVGLSRVTIDPTDPFCRSHAVMGELGTHEVLLMLCSGAAAESHYLKRTVALAGTDLEQARLLASCVAHADLDAPETEAALRRYQILAAAEAVLNWTTITRVAAALTRRTTLAGPDIEALVGKGMETHMNAAETTDARAQREARVAQAAETFAREQQARVAAAAAAAAESRAVGGRPSGLSADLNQLLGVIAHSTRDFVHEMIGKAVQPLDRRITELEQRTYMGTWHAETAYRAGSLVTHDGSLWIARSDSAGVRPGSTHCWQLAARKGADGRPGKDAA